MAGRNLTRYVCVDGPDGMVQFGPGDDVPTWAVKKITNPNVWDARPVKAAAAKKTTSSRKTTKPSAPDTPPPADDSDGAGADTDGEDPDASAGDDS
ncbi:hypothetical protein [Rhodococcus rhodochrous]|uniref:hypothetical protein n=1 Tax=Rhodococcus rhodochrous TaxID=1829 RepID=UPI001782A301|nr:hypothetical protein [Rhodococcus rhodochrous]QOH55252.1 hypothetical protein C6Y44_04155 [Rhodococcus rhodochrous]